MVPHGFYSWFINQELRRATGRRLFRVHGRARGN